MDFNKTALGLELGSTRIKAVLLDENHNLMASGSYEWENQFINNIWTYSTESIHEGVQKCFADLKKDVFSKYNTPLTSVGAMGISGMMHGYLPFDSEGKQLTEFRTWRNTITGVSAEKLTKLFGFNIPQRWSIAHLYQAILNGESHVGEMKFLTTLAGYIHWKLTGEKVMGIGEASGMFPIDSTTTDFNAEMLDKFDNLAEMENMSWKLRDILPKVLCAGEFGGTLTEEGAKFLDPTGEFKGEIKLCPPEGDAGTGMTANNAVAPNTGNISAGTSDFAMIVVDHELGVHREIDMVTTPTGMPVAMVHCNNCTSDINAWVDLFAQFAKAIGADIDKAEIFPLLFNKALEGDVDCGGLLSYNYFSGEGVTDLDEGRPIFARMPDAKFSLENFMRTHLLSALATLKIGMDILLSEEKISIEKIYGHGGFFKTPEVGQRILSAAIKTPVSVMEMAGEGGPYGMALLAAFMLNKSDDEKLEDYLEKTVFAQAKTTTLMANAEEIAGFDTFIEKYKRALPVEQMAIKTM